MELERHIQYSDCVMGCPMQGSTPSGG